MTDRPAQAERLASAHGFGDQTQKCALCQEYYLIHAVVATNSNASSVTILDLALKPAQSLAGSRCGFGAG